jgi:limonene-1,2-epoxide hydrolase
VPGALPRAQAGRLRAARLSGIEVNFPVASVVDVEDGLIVRYLTYRDLDAAMAVTADEREPAPDG